MHTYTVRGVFYIVSTEAYEYVPNNSASLLHAPRTACNRCPPLIKECLMEHAVYCDDSEFMDVLCEKFIKMNSPQIHDVVSFLLGKNCLNVALQLNPVNI